MIDYYAALEVTPTATAAQIKNSYRRLARRLHPDVNPDPWAAERFKEVTEAYEVLRDDVRRAEYDATPRSSTPYEPEPTVRSLVATCKTVVSQLRNESRVQTAARRRRSASVYDMAAEMLDKSIADYENAMRNGMFGARQPAILPMVERFLNTIDPTETIGDERSSEHLRTGVLGMVGLSRVTHITGSAAEPQAKEAAARAIMFALSSALISAGVLTLETPQDTARRLTASAYEAKAERAFRELESSK